MRRDFRQRRLHEHPALQVAAETVDEYDGRPIAGAEFQIAEPPAVDLDLAGCGRGGLVAGLGGGLYRRKTGDESVNLGVRHG